MSPLSKVARLLLILHGLVNVVQGIFGLISPQEHARLAGNLFVGAPDKALQSIGLGGIGVGWYQLIFAYQNNQALILATIPMRLIFATVILSWGNRGVVVYEVGVASICGVALLA